MGHRADYSPNRRAEEAWRRPDRREFWRKLGGAGNSRRARVPGTRNLPLISPPQEKKAKRGCKLGGVNKSRFFSFLFTGSVCGGGQEGTSGHYRGRRGNDHVTAAGERRVGGGQGGYRLARAPVLTRSTLCLAGC